MLEHIIRIRELEREDGTETGCLTATFGNVRDICDDRNRQAIGNIIGWRELRNRGDIELNHLSWHQNPQAGEKEWS